MKIAIISYKKQKRYLQGFIMLLYSLNSQSPLTCASIDKIKKNSEEVCFVNRSGTILQDFITYNILNVRITL